MTDGIRVELPPGCNGLDTPDRSRVYTPKERGGDVIVEANYARALGQAGLRILPSKLIGLHRRPRAVKACSCGGLNFAENDTCPRCGADISNLEVTIQ